MEEHAQTMIGIGAVGLVVALLGMMALLAVLLTDQVFYAEADDPEPDDLTPLK